MVLLTIVGAVLGGICWFFGTDPWYAAGFGLVLIAVGIGWAMLGGGDVPEWRDEQIERPEGVRDDVVRLAWSLRQHKGQVHEPAFKRVRALAAARLEPHGLNLDDPQQRRAVEGLIGAAAYQALHATAGRLPSLTAVQHCLIALDLLVGDRPPPHPTPTDQLRGILHRVLRPRKEPRREGHG